MDDAPPPEAAPAPRPWTPLDFLLLGVGLLLLTFTKSHFSASSGRSHHRACMANQQALMGALEMYSLDENTPLPVLTPEIAGRLLEAGYLQELPDDPGGGPGSWIFVHTTEGAPMLLSCYQHGALMNGGAPDPTLPDRHPGETLTAFLERRGAPPDVVELARTNERPPSWFGGGEGRGFWEILLACRCTRRPGPEATAPCDAQLRVAGLGVLVLLGLAWRRRGTWEL